MPIFVQWKWKENTETFLVIFHFDADYSEKNLRSEKMRFAGRNHVWYMPDYSAKKFLSEMKELESDVTSELLLKAIEQTSRNLKNAKVRSITTWSPSHPELALLFEVLSCANIINGLKPWKKRELRVTLELEPIPPSEDKKRWRELTKNLGKLPSKKVLIGSETSPSGKRLFCVELCPEYINYLKEVLKPYI